MDPKGEYESRLERWNQAAQAHEKRHRWTGDARLLSIAVLVIFAILLRNTVAAGLLFAVVVAGLFLSGMWHDRILQKRDAARRLVRFYECGLERIQGTWMGKGSGGDEFPVKGHPYAADLDIFGAGSVFEYINATHTQDGRNLLAHWLLKASDSREIIDRQKAVAELRGKVDLREAMETRIAQLRSHIRTDVLRAWAAEPCAPAPSAVRFIAFCLPLVTWPLFVTARGPAFIVSSALQSGFAWLYLARTSKSIASMKLSAHELGALARVLELLEREEFQSPRLQELRKRWSADGVSASQRLRKMERLAGWMDARDNALFAMVGPAFLLKTQFAFALDAWRADSGPKVAGWLDALGEMEALLSLSGYAFEHPGDVFPELDANAASPLIVATEMAHPLIPEDRAARNDIHLDAERPLQVISGSNMSGKSTWLRAIGCNAVLAMAGAPVRARAFRISPLKIGASIRAPDSLQEGVSRFYAEILRLRQIVDLTGQSQRVLFLIDEMLGGTNSHDRRIGAASVVKALVARRAVGLITTHDLALTRVAEEVIPPGVNFHFEDQLRDGKLFFDYRLKPGVVTHSNALELMRSIGLAVE